jgi:hypothetical protein
MTKGSRCVIFMSSILSNGTMVSRKSDYVICMGLKTLRREANGLKRVRSKQSDPLKTSSLFMMKKAVSLLIPPQNLGGHWFGSLWSLENVFVIQYIHVLYFVCWCPRFLVIGPCLFHNGFSCDTLNIPHQTLFNFFCLFTHVFLFKPYMVLHRTT